MKRRGFLATLPAGLVALVGQHYTPAAAPLAEVEQRIVAATRRVNPDDQETLCEMIDGLANRQERIRRERRAQAGAR